ncbi:MAG: prolyl oligopeptidase family serine peptidase [Kiritimatiellae bacterium]|nr:prolyl oligopeptidase family serine peptidase [Kiritimatiellia bacterium]MDD5520867.1 prolyl oligopeptidase family serine peptidase [Kiritimatiellia bacterium]
MRSAFLAVALVMASGAFIQNGLAAPSYKPTKEELQSIQSRTDELKTALKDIAAGNVDDALMADVEVYQKAALWIMRYAEEEFYARRYVADTLTVLDHGLARAKELKAGQPSWPARKGQLVRAYRSRVDGSVQPYGLVIPDGYDGTKPVRLDVILHGRGTTLNEVNFIVGHDSAKPVPPDQDYIRLDVYGRGNNAYRWAGETDVFEAVASVRQRYRIDPRRIVLRGFSMGGAGAWHIGLHHPDQWAAVEAGAGFTDTKRYTKLDNLPPQQEAALHIYDAVDYVLNAFNVPFVGYSGEDDKALQQTINIREQLIKEGFSFKQDGLNWLTGDLSMLFLVGPKTGHKFHPESKQRSDQFIQTILAKERTVPNHIRFVTYTTRYNRCFWLTVAALEKHYQRAEVDARRSDDGMRIGIKTRNVTRLILPDQPQGPKLIIDGSEIQLSPHLHSQPSELVLDKKPAGWSSREGAGKIDNPQSLRKIHGLQGPIDDAFADSFLCVRPTGIPARPLANGYSVATLNVFTREFAKWMRGDLRIKDDAAITPADIANHHMILFGDPESNRLLGQIAGRLPIRWNRENIVVGEKSFSAVDHMLVMIYPNPLNPKRYVVINSGHTFHEKEFRGTNALLFSRLGDYAVLRLVKGADGKIEESVELAGFFGEEWELAR